MRRCYWIYILASAIGGTLYIGVTNNLVRRVYEHKMGLADGFTKKYTFIGWSISNNTPTLRLQSSAKSVSRDGIGHGKFGSLRS
jgi:predicted GIY-YIG superfamily endonuclease